MAQQWQDETALPSAVSRLNIDVTLNLFQGPSGRKPGASRERAKPLG
jgi:hypothetical protein